ncbi:MAG TPA: hypothetical protein VMQ51_05165 [Candidatus Binatia bacterium]|nr:hypothetical protein [Candidatus Binatia bacterium]
MEVAADGTHDDLARVQADADLDVDPIRPADAIGVAADRFLHAERREARAGTVVLVREGGVEERHDPVTHHLVDGAFVAMDGLDHPLQDGVEDLARFLGIAIGQQFHRTLEVGEEDGDLLALTLQRSLRGHDLLDEMLGRVALGRLEPCRRRGHGGERASAAPAELVAGVIGEAAGGADQRQRCGTSGAEAPAFPVLGLAPGAGDHSGTLTHGCAVCFRAAEGLRRPAGRTARAAART